MNTNSQPIVTQTNVPTEETIQFGELYEHYKSGKKITPICYLREWDTSEEEFQRSLQFCKFKILVQARSEEDGKLYAVSLSDFYDGIIGMTVYGHEIEGCIFNKVKKDENLLVKHLDIFDQSPMLKRAHDIARSFSDHYSIVPIRVLDLQRMPINTTELTSVIITEEMKVTSSENPSVTNKLPAFVIRFNQPVKLLTNQNFTYN